MGRTNTAINKPVKAAKILDILRGTGAGPKAYTYSIAVTHIGLPDSQPPTLIQRTFDNFFDLHLQLVGHFPEAAGISTGAEVIRATTTTATTAAASPASGAGGGQAGQPPVKRILPELPGQMMFVSEAAARARTVQLQAYLDVLLTLPPKISRSPVVLKFFRSS
ncbi:hypothetical protein BC831DRAFT_499483 [Entophlyctis helioformis]|nr:hypothetical protein BC831DRAFT_499483 [Entophlyctis helioformis]